MAWLLKTERLTWTQHLDPTERNDVTTTWNATIHKGQLFFYEFRFMRPGNIVRWIMSHATPAYLSGATYTDHVRTFETIRSRKWALKEVINYTQARKLKEAKKMAE